MPAEPEEDKLREHTYDGIQEFDKRLPNWWLWTLYGSIIFSFCYWFYYHFSGVNDHSLRDLRQELNRIAAVKAESSAAALSDDDLWAMSQDAAVVAAGSDVFSTTCASCHAADLTGGIGPSLVDAEWVHGAAPHEIMNVVANGVLEKGMPAWEPVLGNQRVAEVTAYVLSHQQAPD